MPSEQVHKLSRFGWLTIAALILFGGVRVVIHVVGVVRYFGTNEAEQRVDFLENCKGFFGEEEEEIDGPNDRDQLDEAYPSVPNIVPETQTRCQTWVKESFKIRDRFLVWHALLWVASAILSFATLLMAFFVLKRNPNVARYMFAIFLVQVLVSFGEIAKAVLQSIPFKEVTTSLWPDFETTGLEWFILNNEILTTGLYIALCLFYWGLVRNVRSKKMWE